MKRRVVYINKSEMGWRKDEKRGGREVGKGV
jgi:hypothetical protein